MALFCQILGLVCFNLKIRWTWQRFRLVLSSQGLNVYSIWSESFLTYTHIQITISTIKISTELLLFLHKIISATSYYLNSYFVLFFTFFCKYRVKILVNWIFFSWIIGARLEFGLEHSRHKQLKTLHKIVEECVFIIV